jgi:hypothetical protein
VFYVAWACLYDTQHKGGQLPGSGKTTFVRFDISWLASYYTGYRCDIFVAENPVDHTSFY